jgi:hypothetical protein
MTTKATNAVLNLVNPPIDQLVLATPLVVSSGGTGLATIAAGSVVIGNGTGAVGQSPPGTAGLPLVSAGAGQVPVFGLLDVASALTGVIGVPHGGTGLATIAAGSVMIGNGAGTIGQSPPGTAGLPFVSTGVGQVPVFGFLDVTTALTGVIGVPHGGTGLASLSAGSVIIGNGTGVVGQSPPGTAGLPLVSTGAGQVPVFGTLNATNSLTGVVPVANGGTGNSVLTQYAVLLGNNVSSTSVASPGSAGNPLVSAGAAAFPLFSDHMTLDTIHTNHLFLGGNEVTILTTDVTYYISTVGNDSNTGTFGSPWLTLQHAYDTLVDHTIFGNFTVNLILANGLYGGNYTAFTANVGNWHISGTTSDPALVGIQTTGSQKDGFHAGGTAHVTVQNLSVSASGGYAIASEGASQIVLSQVNVGTSVQHIAAFDGGNVSIIYAYTIFGAADSHLFSQHGTITASSSSLPIQVFQTGAHTFPGGFALADSGGYIRAVSGNYSALTGNGPHFTVSANGVIETDGSDPDTYFPGNATGVTTTGGVYF